MLLSRENCVPRNISGAGDNKECLLARGKRYDISKSYEKNETTQRASEAC